MPPDATLRRRDHLLAVLDARWSGALLEELQAANPGVPRRTLQRDLSALVAEGAVVAEGAGRSRRFRRAGTLVSEPTAEEAGESSQPRFAFSPEAAALVAAVRGPLGARTPVGYRRDWLDAYRPNEDAWIPADMRARLHAMGRVDPTERPAGTYARQILDRLLIDLSWASSHLEGNTYTRLDTENLVAFGRAAEGRDAQETQMILNHKAAIELLVEEADRIDFNRFTVLNLHAALADNLLGNPAAVGRLRAVPVHIGGSVYLPTAIPTLIAELFDLILRKAQVIEDPFEQAFFAMVHLPYLQPFEDVNKRVSRLAANIPFIRNNLAPLSFVDVESGEYVGALLAVYERRRIEPLRELFAWAYARSCLRYRVVREAMPAPDPLRLRYRSQVREAVRGVVLSAGDIDDAALRAALAPGVDAADLEALVAITFNELHHLYEGNIARFGLRLSEYERWAARPR